MIDSTQRKKADEPLWAADAGLALESARDPDVPA